MFAHFSIFKNNSLKKATLSLDFDFEKKMKIMFISLNLHNPKTKNQTIINREPKFFHQRACELQVSQAFNH